MAASASMMAWYTFAAGEAGNCGCTPRSTVNCAAKPACSSPDTVRKNCTVTVPYSAVTQAGSAHCQLYTPLPTPSTAPAYARRKRSVLVPSGRRKAAETSAFCAKGATRNRRLPSAAPW